MKSSVDNEGGNVLTESCKAARWLEARRHSRAKSVNDAKVTYRIAVFFPRFSGLHEVQRETRVTG